MMMFYFFAHTAKNTLAGYTHFFWSLMLMFAPISIGAQMDRAPNILFIMADDLGYGDLGCYGQRTIQTPNLDKLASEGKVFTRCYTGSPVCAPSRSVLMTGQHTGHTTVRGNTGKFGVPGLGGRNGRVPLNEEDTTLAEVLKQAGYITGCIGKWGLGEPNSSGEPRKQGFDYFFGFLNQRRAHNYYTEYLWENEIEYPLLGNKDGGEKIYAHDLFTKKALEFLELYKDTSFFLYLPYTIPHDKYQIPSTAPYTEQPWSRDEKVHAAMVTRLDRDIGTILAQMERSGLSDNTIVFFCSDNGAAQRWEGRFDSSGKLRGRKRDLYEGGIRTPMVIRAPNLIAGGSKSETPWYFADVLPTLAAVANVNPPHLVDGINMWPSIVQNDEVPERELYWEFHERGFQQAMMLGNWKMIYLGKDVGMELYDLGKDPFEEENLADGHPEKIKELTLRLNAARTPSENWPIE